MRQLVLIERGEMLKNSLSWFLKMTRLWQYAFWSQTNTYTLLQSFDIDQWCRQFLLYSTLSLLYFSIVRPCHITRGWKISAVNLFERQTLFALNVLNRKTVPANIMDTRKMSSTQPCTWSGFQIVIIIETIRISCYLSPQLWSLKTWKG